MHSQPHRSSHTLFIIHFRMVFLTHAPKITNLSLCSISLISSHPKFLTSSSAKIATPIMASLQMTALSSHSIGSLRRTSAVFHAPSVVFSGPVHRSFQAHPNFRFQNEVRLQLKKRLSPVFANTNPSQGSDNSKAIVTAGGPPFLTILAGLVVFLGICGVIGTIAMWLISLIVHPPALK